MGIIRLNEVDMSAIPNPPAGTVVIGIDLDGETKQKDSSGTITPLADSGSSGFSGYSGTSGIDGIGTSGFSGYSGNSGYSGESGFTGVSGYSGSGGGLPIVRYVYLVDDVSDEILMGGAGSNVYTSAQDAYDAAVALAAGTTPVIIKVGKSVGGGNITLTADWDIFVSIEGLSATNQLSGIIDSSIGDIIGDNASGNGFNINVNLTNVNVGYISSKATGATGNGGSVWITGDGFGINSIDVSLTDPTNTGLIGSVNFYNNTNKTSCGAIGYITMTATNSSSQGGDLVIFGYVDIDTIDYVARTTFGSINLISCNVSTFNITQESTSTGLIVSLKNGSFTNNNWILGSSADIQLQNCKFGDTTLSNLGASIGNIIAEHCDFTQGNSLSSTVLDLTDTASSTYFRFIAYTSVFSSINNLSANSRLFGCTIANVITNIGTSCLLINTSINGGPTVGGAACITNGATPVSVTFNSSYFRIAPSSVVTLINNESVLESVRYVYLVQDASDVTKMGDRHNNVYSTAQTAYDAANTLQVALGGTNRVIVKVGNVSAGGGITLTSDWNANVWFQGINSEVSVIGTITLTNASGNGRNFGTNLSTMYVTFSNIRFTSISTNATGTSGDAGSIFAVFINCRVTGSITAECTNASNTTGSSGTINLSNCQGCVFGIISNRIVATSSTGSTGILSIIAVDGIIVGRIGSSTTNNPGASQGYVIFQNILFTDSIYIASLGGYIFMNNCKFIDPLGFGMTRVVTMGTDQALTSNLDIVIKNVSVLNAPGSGESGFQGIDFQLVSGSDHTNGDFNVEIINVDARYLGIENANNLRVSRSTISNEGGEAAILIDCIKMTFLHCTFDHTGGTVNTISIDNQNYTTPDVTFLHCDIFGGVASIDAATAATSVNTGSTYYENAVGANITLVPLTLDA